MVEQYDARDAEDACRRQLCRSTTREAHIACNMWLQIEKRIAFTAWVTAKRHERSDRSLPATTQQDDDGEDKREKAEAAFKEWLSAKRTQRIKGKKKLSDENASETRPSARADGSGNGQARPRHLYQKPKSLHVNPRVKGKHKKLPVTMAAKPKTKTPLAIALELSLYMTVQEVEQVQRAYEEWLERKQLEDRVRRQLRQLQLLREEENRAVARVMAWRKKSVVCAYSTNSTPEARARNCDGTQC
ncbi:TPA: hypothetical protein N0F65_006843 [Lagenidium giganteum]|uniref:Uncharacterized protein n=1 Tax=Lagenidium giganteum TaxID=4803 RepID=A0AAV2ZEB7_9STRA|nr:TPA: hypothetical protein N0F65_006843 [Lagenidium giganteum]